MPTVCCMACGESAKSALTSDSDNQSREEVTLVPETDLEIITELEPQDIASAEEDPRGLLL